MIKWSTDSCLYLNTKRCNVLHTGEKNTNCDYFMSVGEGYYKLSNTLLAKDIGVTLHPKLNPNQHIYEATHKATKI